jgi:hypothetical protein
MPPRRERQQTEGAEPPAEPAVAQPHEGDTVAQRLERRRAELLHEMQLKSIQEIKQELADSPRASSMAVTGKESPIASLISYRQSASTKLSHSAKRAVTPSIYKDIRGRALKVIKLR